MRALTIVLDSVGCGHTPDAADHGDLTAITLRHLYKRIPDCLREFDSWLVTFLPHPSNIQ